MKAIIKKTIARFTARLKLIKEEYELGVIFRNPRVNAGEGVSIDSYFSANLPEDNYLITIGNFTRFKRYCHILLFPGAELHIGKNVFFNNYCSINCLHKIHIGDDTMFGEGVKLYDHNHSSAFVDGKLIVEKAEFDLAPISIGNNCWIGSNVTILKGVTIGDNTIIGANCLVYKSVPANTIVKASMEYIIENER